jgi:SAM-dependent methyltransferase
MLLKLVGSAHGTLVFSRRAHVLGSAIRELLPHGASVLDIGTGDGTIAAYWKSERPDLSVEGVDVLVRPDAKIPVAWFDGQTLPFRDNSFDVTTMVDVLHHANDQLRLLSEAARVARRYVIIKDHVAASAFDRATLAAMDWVGNAPHGVSLPYNYLSQPQWIDLTASANLEVETTKMDLGLYAFPLNELFGRNLHFISCLRKKQAK